MEDDAKVSEEFLDLSDAIERLDEKLNALVVDNA